VPKRKGRDTSTQDAIPLEGLFRSGIVRQKLDGGFAVALEVTPTSLGLLDKRGREDLIDKFHGFLRQVQGRVFFFARDVTPDLSPFLEAILERGREAGSDGLYATSLELHGQLRSLLAGQKVREKRFYVVIPHAPRGAPLSLGGLLGFFVPTRRAREETEARRRRHLTAQAEGLLQRASEARESLKQADLPTKQCTPEEILNWMRDAYDPTRAPISFKQAARPIVTVAREER
jgi:hypothetical protein